VSAATRVVLVNPPSPERLGAPLLGQQYVAAALVARGCEVRVLDGAARHVAHDLDGIVADVERFAPHIVGVGLFTRWVWHAYRLVDALRGRVPLLVAGGAHATVRAEETLARGFDVAVEGEAEATIVRLVDRVEGRARLEEIPGIRWRDADGTIRRGPPAEVVADLDRLPFPVLAQDLYDPRWYSPSATDVIPGGVLTSRGCPARCTFCANYVTGRGFRYRAAASVVAELNAWHRRTGVTFFPCWDDALTANPTRLLALCETLARDLEFPLAWSAITRATMVTPRLLAAMRRAGLVTVNFGVESGDDAVLRAIKKGVTTEHVVRALAWAKSEGLRTAANFMLGFPQETPAALERTLAFMQRIAPLTDTFSTLGVVVPFPGTPLYDNFHAAYGFTDWWLREDHARHDPPPPVDDADRFYRHYIDDANLALDFFRYTPEMRALIRECLRFKAEHNLRAMGLLKDPVFRAAPPEWFAAPAPAPTGLA
jgi:anaerobic magnesium-protoporphyrin IX monomethyl ester cyclase